MNSRRERASARATDYVSAQAGAGHRRARITLIVAALLAAITCSAAPAGAEVVSSAVTHQRFGIVPSVFASRPSASACVADNSDCTALTYHGGAVMHGERMYQLFWTPSGHSLTAAYESGLNTYLTTMTALDYSPSTMFSVDQQFYDRSGPGGAKRFTPYALSNAGQLVDTTAFPTSGCIDRDGAGNLIPLCLTDAQLRTELHNYITAHHLPTGPTVEYFIFTPKGVGSCFDSTSSSCAYTGFCGYHSYTGTANSNTEVLYANMPWAYQVSGCDVNTAFGTGYANGTSGIDPVVGVWSHEASETMTDPNLNAWYQAGGTDSGYENGDKCAYIYGSGGYGSTTGLAHNSAGFYNYALLGHVYLAQLEWDQRIKTCSRVATDTQPVMTISPTSTVHGSATTFTAHVTDPYGVNQIRWVFGDGGSAITTTTTVSHTYATAGTRTMVVIVTDNHGSEKRVLQSITVS